MPEHTGANARASLANTDRFIRQAEARLEAVRKVRDVQRRTLALLVKAPGSAPAYWLKLGRVDQTAWRERRERLPLGRIRVGDYYFAYANGAGAVGVLEVTAAGARWCLRLPTLDKAIAPAHLRKLGLYHPSRAVAPVAEGKADILYEALVSRLTGISL